MNATEPAAPHVTNADARAVGAVDGLAALGWLSTAAGATEHLALPIDLFMLTVYRGPDPDPQDEPEALGIALTPLRTRPDRFRSQHDGELAFGLLTPAGLMRLGGAPLAGRTDCRVALDEPCTASENRRLADRLARGDDPAQRMNALVSWLEERLTRHVGPTPAQSRVAEAAHRIHECNAPLDRAEIPWLFGISPRQLERDFRHWLGISPNGYARLVLSSAPRRGSPPASAWSTPRCRTASPTSRT